MSSMSYSGRTLTPPPQSQDQADIEDGTPGFVPHLLDVLSVLELGSISNNQNIPRGMFSEIAVDSSMLIGSGASFTASRQSLPIEPERISQSRSFNGTTIIINHPAYKRPKHIVYKVARVVFGSNESALPEHRRALTSVLTEIHALTYPPLLRHKNIIDFLGIAWGCSPYDAFYKLPAIVVEYAELGTLTMALKMIRPSDILKRYLCADVANGLKAIHSCGLVHGDLKPDNVLVCSGERPTAKLSDFGYAVVSESATDYVFLSGTDPWKAPEADGPLSIEDIRYSDVYSLGLLAWAVAVNRNNPFDAMDMSRDEVSNSVIDIRTMKLDGSLPQRAGQEAEVLLSQQEVQMSNSGAQHDPDREGYQLEEKLLTRSAKPRETGLLGRLERLLVVALNREPRARDLYLVSTLLSQNDIDLSGLNSTILSLDEVRNWRRRGYKHHRMSYVALRQLPPDLQVMASKSLDMSDPRHLFLSVVCYMNGYGVSPDVVKALQALRQAAALKHVQARAYLYRVHAACGEFDVQGADLTAYLFEYAIAGARLVMQDLRKAGTTDRYEQALSLLHESGGVGACYYNLEKMFQGMTPYTLLRRGHLKGIFERNPRIVAQVINRRRDTLLHLAGACGYHEAVHELVEHQMIGVNEKNLHGETTLLCACRAGQVQVVHYLLAEGGANASIAANNGESVLHWVLSFQDNVQALAEDMVRQGASVDTCTTVAVCHSSFPGTMDVDFQMPGTPLAWAAHHGRADIVRTLLSLGADPKFEYEPGTIHTPINIAAHFHQAECLEIMLEWLDQHQTLVLYTPLHHVAVEAADKFSMIIRNGENYLEALHSTLDLLKHKSAKTSMTLIFGGPGNTLLHFAVMIHAEEVVHYMLKHQWHATEVNVACGVLKRTPLIEAASQNNHSLVKLLLHNKADVKYEARSPYDERSHTWSALHAFAHEGHDLECSMVALLIHAGVKIDGRPAGSIPSDESLPGTSNYYHVETPFGIALRSNSFNLANSLIFHGADVNALSLASGMIVSHYPLTVLGHIIVSNARYSTRRLRYLFDLRKRDVATIVNFVVDPARRLSALHRVALAHDDLFTHAGQRVQREDFDFDTNRDILLELLRVYKEPSSLDLPSGIEARTALHLAIEVANVEAVRELIRAGASKDIEDAHGCSPSKRAALLARTSDVHKELLQYV